MNIPANQPKELKWKTLDGKLIPLNELSNKQLKEFRKIAGKKSQEYYRNFEFFSSMLEEMDSILHTRLEEAQNLVNELKLAEKEV